MLQVAWMWQTSVKVFGAICEVCCSDASSGPRVTGHVCDFDVLPEADFSLRHLC